jgi:7-cyano-7-deazaguanine synthase
MEFDPMNDCVAVVSGGLDSVTLLHHLVKVQQRKPAVITFRYGQRHDKEVMLAKRQAQALGCQPHLICDLSSMVALFQASALVDRQIDIPSIASVKGDDQPITYVPNRNMIFLALAAAYAESNGVNEVYYGAQKQDMYGYWDTTPEFLKRVNAAFALNRRSAIQIHAPFVDKSKADILRIGLSIEVDYAQTWSCYVGSELACGQCPTCAERLNAFAELGLQDPVIYQTT